MTRPYIPIMLATLLLVFGGILSGAAEQRREWIWTFDADHVGGPPTGFSFGRTGGGRAGHWVVQADADAPSGLNVLVQTDADSTDYRFPLAVVDGPLFRDVRLSVNCKPVSGQVDQAAGLVFRYQDDGNYYVVRANALEDNVNLYRVVNGQRRQFAGWRGPVTGNAWHTLHVDAHGDHFEISWDGQKVMDAHDRTFLNEGHVGVWTKADSVTEFDDLSAESAVLP